MELKIEYNQNTVKNEEIEALIVFLPEDIDIIESGTEDGMTFDINIANKINANRQW